MRSAVAPSNKAKTTPVALNTEATQLAATRSSPSSVRNIGRAGGSLPTWPAAMIPATRAMTTVLQRVLGAAVIGGRRWLAERLVGLKMGSLRMARAFYFRGTAGGPNCGQAGWVGTSAAAKGCEPPTARS